MCFWIKGLCKFRTYPLPTCLEGVFRWSVEKSKCSIITNSIATNIFNVVRVRLNLKNTYIDKSNVLWPREDIIIQITSTYKQILFDHFAQINKIKFTHRTDTYVYERFAIYKNHHHIKGTSLCLMHVKMDNFRNMFQNYTEVCGIYIDIIVSKNFLLDILCAQSCEHNSCNLHPQVITNFMLIFFSRFLRLFYSISLFPLRY